MPPGDSLALCSVNSIGLTQWSSSEWETSPTRFREEIEIVTDDSIVDLAFPITPGRVPLDHGYALYSALVGPLPKLHEASWLGIHPLSGRKIGDSTLVLTRGSYVTLRLPAEQIPIGLGLANRNLRIAQEIFQLGGQPTLRALAP